MMTNVADYPLVIRPSYEQMMNMSDLFDNIPIK
jgi:hypothetical protein